MESFTVLWRTVTEMACRFLQPPPWLRQLQLSFACGAFAAAVVAMAVTTAYAETVLTFGVYTSDKPTTMVRQFRPGLNVLEKKVSEILGSAVRIRLQVARTYEAGLLDLVNGRVDFARFGPASYVMAKRRDPTISILAIESNGGTKEFYGIIAVHRDSPVIDLKQLRGRSFAFGDDSSTIGRYLAQLLLLENDIVAGTLGRFEYLGRHDRVGAAVGLGQFEAGALKDSTFLGLVQNGSPIRELARFPNTTKPWIARSGLAPHLHDALSRSLLALRDPVSLQALGKDGFLRGTDSDYDTIRRALERNKEFFASRQSSDASWEEGVEAELTFGRP